MPTSIQSAGVAPKVNLRNSWHTGNKACKQGIHPGFETQERSHQKSKTGVSVAPQKGLMCSKNLEKKRFPGRFCWNLPDVNDLAKIIGFTSEMNAFFTDKKTHISINLISFRKNYLKISLIPFDHLLCIPLQVLIKYLSRRFSSTQLEVYLLNLSLTAEYPEIKKEILTIFNSNATYHIQNNLMFKMSK